MNKETRWQFLLMLCLSLGGVAQAQSQNLPKSESGVNAASIELTSEAQENALLDAIAQERAYLEQTYLAEQKACYQKFRVTHCLDTLKKSYRDDIKRLRQHEISIKDTQRQRNAAFKKAQVERNLVEAQKSKENAVQSSPLEATFEATFSAPLLSEDANISNEPVLKETTESGINLKPTSVLAPISSTAKTPQEIEENIQKYQKKQRQAASHRANKQAAEKSKAAPLIPVE